MPTLGKNVVRLQLGTASNPPVYPFDKNTGLAPQLWRGTDTEFQLAIFDPYGFTVDLSNVDFLQVAIFPMPILNLLPDSNFTYNPYSHTPYPNVPAAPLQFVTVPKGSITAKVSAQNWIAGISQQVKAAFTWNQTAQLDLGGQIYRDFWLCVSSLIGNSRLVYGGARLRVYESGQLTIYLPNASAPIFIPALTVFYVPPNIQIPFSQTIDIEGTLDIEGALIQF